MFVYTFLWLTATSTNNDFVMVWPLFFLVSWTYSWCCLKLNFFLLIKVHLLEKIALLEMWQVCDFITCKVGQNLFVTALCWFYKPSQQYCISFLPYYMVSYTLFIHWWWLHLLLDYSLFCLVLSFLQESLICLWHGNMKYHISISSAFCDSFCDAYVIPCRRAKFSPMVLFSLNWSHR
jgi:hypothetical protein